MRGYDDPSARVLAALLIGTTLAGLVGRSVRAAEAVAPPAVQTARDAEIRMPELPAVSVTIRPGDLDGLGTGSQPSGTAAKPAAGASDLFLGRAETSSPAQPTDQPVDVELRTGSVGPTPTTAQPTFAPPPHAEPPAEPPKAEAPVGPVSPPAAAAAPQPAAAPPVEAADLDADVLHHALDAFVGVEPPAPPAGRPPSSDLLRFKQRQDIAAFYATRNYAPIWVADGRFNSQARSVLSRIDHAAEDGLDLRASPVTVPRGGDPAALALSEIGLTEAVVAYGNQATGGRVDPAKISALIDAKPDVATAARVLGAVVGAADPGEALRGLNPPQKGYALLRAKLAELRQKTDMASQVPIPYGPILKPGMRDARVPFIRTRFGLDIPASDAAEAGLVYDTRVAAAVADFQRAHHLPPSGVLTIRTIAALSGGNPRRLENEIVANMEGWRWLPRDLGKDYLEVNIPNYTLDVMHGDAVFHHARVVVGQPDKPTPIFSETMRFIIVNPYWNVPLSIVKKEMMPKLAADPDYFANHGYETVERNGITYVRQPPGETNALGRIKFMFPNKFSVYLHDTNARALFGKEQRALSHGCVRVEGPFKLAEVVLGAQNGWSEARVKKLVGGDERTINLPVPLPLHIVYFTAFVDDKGQLQLRDDVYGYSAKLHAALGLDT